MLSHRVISVGGNKANEHAARLALGKVDMVASRRACSDQAYFWMGTEEFRVYSGIDKPRHHFGIGVHLLRRRHEIQHVARKLPFKESLFDRLRLNKSNFHSLDSRSNRSVFSAATGGLQVLNTKCLINL